MNHPARAANPCSATTDATPQTTQLSLSWADLEPEAGVYNFDALERFQAQLPSNASALVNLRIPDDERLDVPAHVETASFADPVFRQQLLTLFDKLWSRLGPHTTSLSVGSHVELFLRAHPDQIDAYADFLDKLFGQLTRHDPSLSLGFRQLWKHEHITAIDAPVAQHIVDAIKSTER